LVVHAMMLAILARVESKLDVARVDGLPSLRVESIRAEIQAIEREMLGSL
jgi:hypothetical protein